MPTAHSQQLALTWLTGQMTPEGAVMISNLNHSPYPEVTGYSIPTMLHCGERARALTMAKWLLRVQEPDGGFLGADGRPHVFDTAQVLRGLLAVRHLLPKAYPAVRRASDWLVQQIDVSSGAWRHPESASWAGIPEAVYLYAIGPLAETVHQRGLGDRHRRLLKRLSQYYARRARVYTNSHFLGYIVAGLVEVGLARKARRVLRCTATPTWPGTAQLAETIIELGDLEKGVKLLEAMAAAQRSTGGWTGGAPGYFEDEEVTWASKFYIDACRALRHAWFNRHADSIPDTIAPTDERLLAAVDALRGLEEGRILDAGCGKGRFLRRLVGRFPRAEFHGCDPISSLLGAIPPQAYGRTGELTNLPYPDSYFDAALCVEALEHAVFVDQALQELIRVTRRGGRVVIIDKDVARWDALPALPWEQWFPENLLGESKPLAMDNGLFRVWSYEVS